MSLLAEIGSGAVGGLLGGIGQLAKDIRQAITGDLPAEKQAEIQQKIMEIELAATNAQMEMITAEAKSSDPWTSRARPAFNYVFYIILLSVGLIAPMIGVFRPQEMKVFFDNVGMGFRAIPADLYTLFGVGYVGYVGGRSWEKVRGATK